MPFKLLVGFQINLKFLFTTSSFFFKFYKIHIIQLLLTRLFLFLKLLLNLNRLFLDPKIGMTLLGVANHLNGLLVEGLYLHSICYTLKDLKYFGELIIRTASWKNG